MTVRWIRYFGTAGAQHINSRKFDSQIPQGYHVPHCVGNPHWRIPNSSVRTNSSATRRTSPLSLKKWLNCMRFPKASLEGFGRCRILSCASHGNFSLVFPRPPLTVRCFLRLKKDKNKTMKTKVFKLHIPRMNIKSSRTHQFLHFQSLQEYQNLQSKIFIFSGRLSL